MTERDRVISITLTEAEWQAFVARHPQPVHWLRERIQHELTLELRDGRIAELQDRRMAGLPAGSQNAQLR